MKCIVLFILIGACSVYGSPAENSIMEHHRAALDIFGNTRYLIEELVKNLQVAAEEARVAIVKFSDGMREELEQFSREVASNIDNFRQQVVRAVQSVSDRIASSGPAMRNCVESRQNESDAILKDTITKTMACAEDGVADIGNMMDQLSELSENSTQFGNLLVHDLRNCTEMNSGNIFGTATCIGGVALRAELQGASYLTQRGILLTRINWGVITLPASLELCAGGRFVEAGIATTRIAMEIGSCAASSVYNSIIGNDEVTESTVHTAQPLGQTTTN